MAFLSFQISSTNWFCWVEAPCAEVVWLYLTLIQPPMTYHHPTTFTSIYLFQNLELIIVLTRKVLSKTRCSTKKCLQDKSLTELLRVQSELEVIIGKNKFKTTSNIVFIQKDNIKLISIFGPMVDNHTRRNPIVGRHPVDINSGGYASVMKPLPILLSATREGLIFYWTN